jgi:magnesium chelatase family protein
MLDRIDIHVEVPRVDYEKLSSDRLGEPSASIRERLRATREWQHFHFEGSDTIVCNFDMCMAEALKLCKVDEGEIAWLGGDIVLYMS